MSAEKLEELKRGNPRKRGTPLPTPLKITWIPGTRIDSERELVPVPVRVPEKQKQIAIKTPIPTQTT